MILRDHSLQLNTSQSSRHALILSLVLLGPASTHTPKSCGITLASALSPLHHMTFISPVRTCSAVLLSGHVRGQGDVILFSRGSNVDLVEEQMWGLSPYPCSNSGTGGEQGWTGPSYSGCY